MVRDFGVTNLDHKNVMISQALRRLFLIQNYQLMFIYPEIRIVLTLTPWRF